MHPMELRYPPTASPFAFRATVDSEPDEIVWDNNGDKVYYQMTNKKSVFFLSLAVMFLLFSSICNSVMDTLQFRFDNSVFARFEDRSYWDPDISWRNKWKDGDPTKGEKFLGSSTVLVFSTDAWHLFKSLCIYSMIGFAVAMSPGFASLAKDKKMSKKRTVLITTVVFIFLCLLYSGIFEFFFSQVWSR